MSQQELVFSRSYLFPRAECVLRQQILASSYEYGNVALLCAATTPKGSRRDRLGFRRKKERSAERRDPVILPLESSLDTRCEHRKLRPRQTKKERKRERERERERDNRSEKKRKMRSRSKSSSATFRLVQIKIVANVFARRDHDGSRRMTRLTKGGSEREREYERNDIYIYIYIYIQGDQRKCRVYFMPRFIDCMKLAAGRFVVG